MSESQEEESLLKKSRRDSFLAWITRRESIPPKASSFVMIVTTLLERFSVLILKSVLHHGQEMMLLLYLLDNESKVHQQLSNSRKTWEVRKERRQKETDSCLTFCPAFFFLQKGDQVMQQQLLNLDKLLLLFLSYCIKHLNGNIKKRGVWEEND